MSTDQRNLYSGRIWRLPRCPCLNGRLLPLQHALPADDCLITSRQTVEHSDASDVLRGRLLKEVVEDLRGEVVRRVVVAADSRTQLLHRAQLRLASVRLVLRGIILRLGRLDDLLCLDLRSCYSARKREPPWRHIGDINAPLLFEGNAALEAGDVAFAVHDGLAACAEALDVVPDLLTDLRLVRFNVRLGLGLQVGAGKAVEVDREVLPVALLVLDIVALDSSGISLLVDGDAHLLDHDLAVSRDDGLQLLKLDLGYVGVVLSLCQRKVLDLLLVRDQVHGVPGPIPPDVRT